MGLLPFIAVCALIVVAGIALQLMMPQGFPLVKQQATPENTAAMVTEIHSNGPVRINEIMSANSGTLTDASGNTPDWVEVANVSAHAVDMKGYALAHNAKAGNVFVFPDMTLEAGECAVVYADGQLQTEGELHAPFKLSASGDVLMLFNQADVAIDTVNIPALAENTAYVRTGANRWEVSGAVTPGLANTDENYRAMTTPDGSSPVRIVELMSSSAHYGPDENGICHDYVILRNDSGAAVDLGGWMLSDDPQRPGMWRIPDGVALGAGQTLLIHCSGLNRTANAAHLHTSFPLSSEGENVLLSRPNGRMADAVSFGLLSDDVALVRGADGAWASGTPTASRMDG